MKRIICFSLTLIMLLSILPIQSRAEGTAESAIPQDGTFAGGPLQQITLLNSAEFYIGKGCSFVVADLMNAGFTSIQVLETAEASDDTVNSAVVSVSIDGNKVFTAGQQFDFNVPIVVEYFRQTEAKLPLASSDLDTTEYRALLKSLYEAGFTNIIVEELYDLSPAAYAGRPIVAMTVDGKDVFAKGDYLPLETPVAVTAHFQTDAENDSASARGKSIISLPYSTNYYLRKSQNDCVQQFRQLGFTNVSSVAVTDTLWGASQPEQVVGISVDGTLEFGHGDQYGKNAEVIVYYHIPEFKFTETAITAPEDDCLTTPYFVADGDDLAGITIKVENEDSLEQTGPYSFTALKPGTATVAAYYLDTLLAECSVEVVPGVVSVPEIQIESITVPNEKISVGVGRFFEMPFTISPDNAVRGGLDITSSNSQIADVLFDENGDSVVRITGIKAGSTSITIKASDKVAAKKQISVVDVLPEEITVTADTSKIYIGMEGTLSANFIPADVTNQKITWKSSAPRVLKVNSDGSYQALSAGEAIITAAHPKGVSGSIQLTVQPVLAKSLKLCPDWDSTKPFCKNSTMTLTAEFIPEDTTDKTITWSSSDEAVATVSPKGVVKAIAFGDATITATTSNGIEGTYPVCVAITPQSFRVSASIGIRSNDHVGNSWSTGFTFNDEPVRSGSIVSIMPGEKFSAGGWAEENDSKPDYGQYTETIELTKEMCKTGFTIEGDVDVRENGGRYSGHYAVWHLKMQFTPVH